MNLKACMFFSFIIKLLKPFPLTMKCSSHGENCFSYKLILEIITGISDLTSDTILPYFATLVVQVLSFLNH